MGENLLAPEGAKGFRGPVLRPSRGGKGESIFHGFRFAPPVATVPLRWGGEDHLDDRRRIANIKKRKRRWAAPASDDRPPNGPPSLALTANSICATPALLRMPAPTADGKYLPPTARTITISSWSIHRTISSNTRHYEGRRITSEQ